MKTILSAFFVFLFTLSSSAQTYSYQPFPKQKGYWKYAERDWQWQFTGKWINEEYTAIGDTLYSPGEGAYYEKNKRIYFRLDTSSVFKVLYDFNLTVGDTFVDPFYEPNSPFYFDSIAVVTFDDSLNSPFGPNRRTLYLDGHGWTEGIGNPSYNGIKYSLHPGTLSGGWEFKCVYSDGVNYPCQDAYILSQPEIVNSLDRLFYPNPFKETIKSHGQSLSLENCKVYNYLGQEVTANVDFNTSEIDFSNLPSGVYFIELNLNNSREIFKVSKQ